MNRGRTPRKSTVDQLAHPRQETAIMSPIADSSVQSKEDVLRILRERRNELRALGVDRIGLFGSFVREEQHAGSDVDVLVAFREGEATFDHSSWTCPFCSKEILDARSRSSRRNTSAPTSVPIS